jgi:ribose/xylose/arabinose/galactoside ABC-type transport system permease subunit
MSAIPEGAAPRPADPSMSASPTPWTRLAGVQRRFQLFQIVALIALFEWGTWTVTDFATKSSIISMLVAASFLGLAGAGQTLVVLVGGIDFSVPAFITGALLVWTNGEATGSAPSFLSRLTSVSGTTFGIGIPGVVVIWAIVAVILGVGLRRTVAGRRLYATGANPAAAELSLIRTRRVWTMTFALSGLLGGLLGIFVGGYAGSGNISLGDPYLFEGLAAVIVGGTAFGARGDYWKTVLGALLLTVLSTVLVGKGYSNADQQIIFGLLILLVVAGYGRGPRLRDRI